MYLKSIVLDDFKSFGGKTTITLRPGYTVITGPNGSGKSNISDAILFVLGPRSSKVIRAGKLTDLIFNGGRGKSPSSSATVSLIFENSDRMIPYDADEITFTRTVKKSGNEDYASYFYVNGKRSSLGEFEQLLREAKLSADGYNFVQQGDVTRIIEMGNAERRRIIDEIAGITAFDSEIERADREREQIEQNLSSARSVISEMKNTLSKLKAEKEQAERFLSLKKETERMKLTLASKRLASYEVEIETIQEQIVRFGEQIENLERETEEKRATAAKIEAQLNEMEGRMDSQSAAEAKEIREKLDQCKIEIAKRTDGIAIAAEQIAEAKRHLKELNDQVRRARSEATQRAETIASLEKRRIELKASIDKLSKELNEIEAKIGNSDEISRKLQLEINNLNAAVQKAEEEKGRLILEKDRLSASIERETLELARAEEAYKNAELEFKDICWQIKEMEGGNKDRETELRKFQERFTSQKRREEELQRAVDVLEREVKTLGREYERIKAQQEAKAETRGVPRALDAILECRDRNTIKGILGTVGQLIKVPNEYARAINAAAGGRLNAVIVETDATAAECIQYLKKNGLGRLIFLPLNKMVEGRPRGKAVMARPQTLGFAIDLVEFEERLRAAIWYVLGDTLVVRSLDELRQLMGGIRLVTTDGDIAEASGAMIGGSAETAERHEGADIAKLGETLRAKNVELEQHTSELIALRQELRSIEEAIRHLREGSGDIQTSLSTLLGRKKQLEKELNDRTVFMTASRDKCNSLQKELSIVLEKISGKEKETATLKAERDGKNAQLLEGKPAEMAERVSTLSRKISDMKDELGTATVDLASAKKEKELIEGNLASMEQEAQNERQKIVTLERKAESMDAEAGKLRIELAALEKMEAKIGEAQAALRKERDALLERLIGLRGEISNASSKRDSISEMIIIQKGNLSSVAGKKKEVMDEIEALKHQGAEPLETDRTSEQLREAIAEAERKLTSMGSVNMLAIEDYEQMEGRCRSLEEEISSFEEKKKSLIKLVDEINRKKKEGLLNVFGAVNANFKEIYGRLSGGAEGELKLENENEPLEGGLIIRVRLKEGRSLRIEALSGGEKSLAALAFIFAVQQFDPSPVYFLDEVDMYLDGVNSEGIARMVKALSSSAQFIQVSLRKVSLNFADRLIGVTKAEEGLSQVFFREVPSMDAQPEPQGVEG
ncbi:MAG: chromosome segregation protein SMC [Methanomassiliicoccales archaeon]